MNFVGLVTRDKCRLLRSRASAGFFTSSCRATIQSSNRKECILSERNSVLSFSDNACEQQPTASYLLQFCWTVVFGSSASGRGRTFS